MRETDYTSNVQTFFLFFADQSMCPHHSPSILECSDFFPKFHPLTSTNTHEYPWFSQLHPAPQKGPPPVVLARQRPQMRKDKGIIAR